MKNQTKYLFIFLITINICFVAHIKGANGNANPRLSNGTDSWEIVWDPGVAAAAFGIALDSEDNIFVCGVIAGGDLLLVKFNSSGNYLWNRTWDYISGAFGKSIALDSSDNIYIAVDALSDHELLLVKYDKFGNFQWNVSSGISSIGQVHRLLLDQAGNIYIVGGQGDGMSTFVAKFNNAGVKQWDYFYGSGGVYADFSLDSSNNILAIGNVGDEMYLFKLDNSGSLLWDISLDGELDSYIESEDPIELYGITLDSEDNIYLAGEDDWSHFLLVKLNSTGQFQWFGIQGKYKRAYVRSNDVCLSNTIALNSLDDIYFAGDTFESTGQCWESPACRDIVLVKYDNSGEFQGQGRWGEKSKVEHATGIVIDSSDNVYLLGRKTSSTYSNIILLKNLGISKSSDLGIAGFDIIITFAISSIISIFLVYKQRKRKNKNK